MTAKKYRINRDPGRTARTRGLGLPRARGCLQTDPCPHFVMNDEAQAGGAMKDDDIAHALHMGRATVERVRRRCVEEGDVGLLAPYRPLLPPYTDGSAHHLAARRRTAS